MARQNRRAKKVYGTKERPRFAVFRSLKNIYTQIINDEEGKTIVSASTVKEKGFKNNVETAKKVGKEIGAKAVKAGIKAVVFDRRERLFHGKVKAVADGARAAGLKF